MDRRETILNHEHYEFVKEKGISSIYPKEFPKAYKDAAISAMDEYMKECAFELLEYMAKNRYECGIVNKEAVFQRKLSVGWETLNKEQLFENFL